MPRKKTINTDLIKLISIDQSIIERKDCLGVNLCFKDADVFSLEEWRIIFYHFKCSVVGDYTITLRTRNSWKGLIMFFLSLAYMKYKGEIEDALWLMAPRKQQRQILITDVSQTYWKLVKDSTGKWETRSDPRIEQIPAAPDYPPCYVVGRYDTESIKQSLNNFCILYGIDKEQSTVETVYSKQVPHQYKTYSVKNPYKRPEPFQPSTVDELMKYAKEKGHDPLREIDLNSIGKEETENSGENS